MQELSLAIELRYIAESAVTAFVVSLLVAATVVASRGWHLRYTRDARSARPQAIHRAPVPRIGSVAIVSGFVAGLVHLVWFGAVPPTVSAATAGLLMAALAPVVGGGIAEDLTGRVGPRQRLAWMALGATVAVVGLGIGLGRVGVQALDPLFAHWPFAVAFTVFAAVGATNAYNIVDGLNGLLAGVSLITLAVVAWIAASVGDKQVFALAILLGVATLGWLPYNWPRARLFAGDGGAYAIGFLSAVLLLMLVARNPQVSPWVGLTAAALPVWETLYSIWRRARIGMSTMAPDQGHLHQLLRVRLHWAIKHRALRKAGVWSAGWTPQGAAPAVRVAAPNGLCSPILWGLHAVVAVTGAIFHDDTPSQVALVIAFALAYVVLHRVLVRERTKYALAVRA